MNANVVFMNKIQTVREWHESKTDDTHPHGYESSQTLHHQL